MNLDQNLIVQISEIAKNHPSISKILLFGSRARGDCHTTSDIDLLVYSSEKISGFSLDIQCDLKTLLEIDITHYSPDLDQDFLKFAQKDGVVIYDKSGI